MPAKTADTAVVTPDEVVWELGKGENKRSYVQTELSIDGEVRIVQLAASLVQSLDEQGFPWKELLDVVNEEGDWNWPKLAELLTLASSQAPEMVTESTCIAFGIHPLNEDGTRNEKYHDEKLFIRKNVHFANWFDYVQTFMAQNDYERMVRPFTLTLTRAIGTKLPGPNETSPEPSTS